MTRQRARWTHDGPPGSNFHELVVLPTLAPELAQDAPPSAPSAASAPASTESVPAHGTGGTLDASATLSYLWGRQYFIYVTAGRTQVVSGGKSTKRPPRKEETKPTTREHPVLAMTRGAFILAALAAHQLDQNYKPGEHNGPPMRIHWTGSPGGKGSAPLIHTDDEWNALLRQLRAKPSINTINVVFDLDEMMPWGRKRVRSSYSSMCFHIIQTFLSQPLSQMEDDDPAELSLGTSVPRVEAYSPLQRAVGQAAQEISQYWKCNKHPTPCFVDATGEHILITPIRLKSWSRAAAAGACVASEAPPDELLQEWTGKPLSAPKARGRSGPMSPSAPLAPTPPYGDSGAAVMAAIMPLLTMIFERGLGGTPATAPASDAPSDKPISGVTFPSGGSDDDTTIDTHLHHHRGSSPPPNVHEELTRCLERFGRERGISLETIDDMIGALASLSYTPDSIAEVPIERLQQLVPNLEEGQVYALKNYARAWYGRVVTKRARRSL
ncbi:hypothetical protein LXA43DRAFT_894915 [Ganoderma leucocontextum]|nr:hypothetical protein LXA43DRAFT_894915 [Ganoderma leucocontextum]